jgi:hypothetical protein
MRFVAFVVAFAGVLAARELRAEERKLEIEAEILGAAGKSLGKVKVLAPARGQATAKATFGSMVVLLDADVGPTFLKDCNMATVQVNQTDGAAVDGKREGRTTIQACGAGSPPTTLPGGTASNKVVVTVRFVP